MSPRCKSLEVTLLPYNGEECQSIAFDFIYKNSNLGIEITHRENKEIIIITSVQEILCKDIWECFRLIYILQALGIGYFYRLHTIRFLLPDMRIEQEQQLYAEKCRDDILSSQLYISAPDWMTSYLFLVSPKELLNEAFLSKFIQLYVEDNLRMIHNASLIQCSNSNISIDMRCAGIIQLFENLGWYNSNPIRNKSHTKNEWNLVVGISHLKHKYKLESFDRVLRETSVSLGKLNNTRNVKMHYDIWKKSSSYLSSIECARFARILMIYYRHIMLKLIGRDTSETANINIRKWQCADIKPDGTVIFH